jgi:hypothetical protein
MNRADPEELCGRSGLSLCVFVEIWMGLGDFEKKKKKKKKGFIMARTRSCSRVNTVRHGSAPTLNGT